MDTGIAAFGIIIARLLAPLLIPRFPLAGVVVAALLDLVDYDYIGKFDHYQEIDRLLDTYYLSFAAYTVLSWKDTLAKNIALIAFALRLLGVALFLATDNQLFFLLFPNFFELFFIFYLVYVRLTHNTHLLSSKLVIVIVTTTLLIAKLFQEYVLHIYLPAPRHTIGLLAPFLELIWAYSSTVPPVLIFHLPAVAVLTWWVAKARKDKYGAVLPVHTKGRSQSS